MAVLQGHMTKIQAVNEMLWSIGEAPISTLTSGVPDAEQAEAILDRVSRQIQTIGWHCNTLRNYTLTKNASNQFALPVNTLKVDTVSPRGNRVTGSPAPASHVNVVMRRSADDTKWLLWDADKNSETWASDPDTLLVEIVQNLEFAELAPALQQYVWTAAAHRFQKGTVGSAALFQFTQQDVDEARALAMQEDLETSDDNMLRDNAHAFNVTWRNHPRWAV